VDKSMLIDNGYVFPVYIYIEILEKIIKLCKGSNKEIFGYLIGNILKWSDNMYIIIEDQLFIYNAIHSDRFSTSQIEGTAGKYEKKFRELKNLKKSDNLRIVGWWHSHPGFGCFLSGTDLHTQEFFFPESYQAALVVDPIKDEFQFFSLDKKLESKYKTISYAILSSE
jgi:proteasome lid subunit RPN8/RPN11